MSEVQDAASRRENSNNETTTDAGGGDGDGDNEIQLVGVLPASSSDNNNNISVEAIVSRTASQELPFLVTHWLAHYQQSPTSSLASTSHRVDEEGTTFAVGPHPQEDALQRIHQAAGMLASAFRDLGAFGQSQSPNLSQDRHPFYSYASSSDNQHNTSFADVLRRHQSSVPPHQLQSIMEASLLTTTQQFSAGSSRSGEKNNNSTGQDDVDMLPSQNLFQAMREMTNSSRGRRLGNEIDLTVDQDVHGEAIPRVISSFQPPAVLSVTTTSVREGSSSDPDPSKDQHRPNVVVAKTTGSNTDDVRKTWTVSMAPSNVQDLARRSAKAMRDFLDIRDTFVAEEDEIASLERSMAREEQRSSELQHPQPTPESVLIAAAIQNYTSTTTDSNNNNSREHVMALLNSKMKQVRERHERTTIKMKQAKKESRDLYRQWKQWQHKFQRFDNNDGRRASSIVPTMSSSLTENRSLAHVMARQYGLGVGTGRGQNVGCMRSFRSPAAVTSVKAVRKQTLESCLSHVITINAHLSFPVYCLQMDRTGRYFVTGADDCLVKLFYMGGAAPSNANRGSLQLNANHARGAVLVTTLRGHASVICDIAVSPDNAFVATASDDGDVRVWGMVDGCPIAVLRGHKGGANMVSWSLTTPYRLITSGMDGFSRVWDVRKAGLKRYGRYVGKRKDYDLPEEQTQQTQERARASNSVDETAVSSNQDESATRATDEQESTIQLPPIPAAPPEHQAMQSPPAQGGPLPPAVQDPAANVAIPVGPGLMPPAAINPGGGQNAAAAAPAANGGNGGNNNNDGPPPGAFVANDNLDEGVVLVSKQQHGNPVDMDLAGPGTRSRRSAVKVICIARCPLGGHFATGSDDGQCRLWEDRDDDRLARIDAQLHPWRNRTAVQNIEHKATRRPASSSRLLAHFTGHMSPITDLSYSNAGDRILTASQKDGMARIWSWKEDRNEINDIQQIVLRLSNINNKSKSKPRQTGRRRGGSSASEGSNIACDVAVWTIDDSKVVTSQCCPTKENGQDIVPGSQAIFVWDSRTGTCLLGIAAAHSKQCPIIVPHPLEVSILCTAGADGFVKVWDLELGKCLFKHQNKIMYGPVAQSNEQEKSSGYLDGTFDSTGTHLLLTDDNGRISIFDCVAKKASAASSSTAIPSWMREQYFASDYYELFYDENGYCVERGSQQPPHLAPQSVRCNHSGTPSNAEVTEVFRQLRGPMPLSEDFCAKERDLVRKRAADRSNTKPTLHGLGNRRRIAMGEYDESRTVLLVESRDILDSKKSGGDGSQRSVSTGQNRNQRTSSQSFSRNYRWLDIEDMERELENADDDEDDGDAEEFVPRPTARVDEELGEAFYADSGDDSDGSEFRSRSRQRGNRGARSRRRRRRLEREQNERQVREPTRTSSRRSRTPAVIDTESEAEDNDAVQEEVWSTNTKPSGPFLPDYEVRGHIFRLPQGAQVRRQWLRRVEKRPSYDGTKCYCPQVGDSVVYIPRVHYEMIKDFPTFESPWLHWPHGSNWPIVRCRVLNIRYRFPYAEYYKGRGNNDAKCVSVVCILTLEATGIPQLSNDRHFPWPKPVFITRRTRNRSQPNTFEISIFESDYADFLIPESLFTWRLQTLETVLRQNDMDYAKVDALTYWSPEGPNDQALEPWGTKILGVNPEPPAFGDHQSGSGFETLSVKWTTEEEDLGNSSPWEITVEGMEPPPPPTLSDIVKRAVLKALAKVSADPAVTQYFMSPVDETRYSDYSRMIEVPMDFSFVEERVAADYYTTVNSVVADVRLIRENCMKYNGQNEELSQFASKAVDDFTSELKNELGSEFLEMAEQQEPLLPHTLTEQAEELAAEEAARIATRRSTRQPSALEQLRSPSTIEVPSRTSNRNRNTRSSRPSSETVESGGTGRVRSQSSRGRIRISRYAAGPSDEDEAEEEQEEPVAKRSRAARTAVSYTEVPSSDGEESEIVAGGDEYEAIPNGRNRRQTVRTTRSSRPSVEASPGGGTAYRRSTRNRPGYNEDSDGDEDENEDLQEESRSSPRRSTRSKSRSSVQDDEVEEEEDGDDDDEEESDDEQQPTRARGSTRNRSRAVRRSTRTTRTADDDDDYDVESESGEDEEEEEEEAYSEGESRSRTHRRGPGKSSRRTSPRKNTRSKRSRYEEESDSNEDGDDQESEEYEASSRKRKKPSPPSRSSKRFRKGGDNASDLHASHLKDWPEIHAKHITALTTSIMEEMSVLDKGDLFAEPVVEKYPRMKRSYLTEIAEPMDFRTIVESNIHSYTSIRQLQRDLKLCFENCIKYNGPSSAFGQQALLMLKQVNDIFRKACEENNVRLPRRW